MGKLNLSVYYKNFKYNINAIESINEDHIRLSKKYEESNRKFSHPLHGEIFSAIQKYFPRYRISDVLLSYADSLVELITKIGLYDKYKDTVEFINYGDEIEENKYSQTTCTAVHLIGESIGFDNQKTEDSISLKMKYVYLHTIFDEYILSVAMCCFVARDMQKQYAKSGFSDTYIEKLKENNYFKVFEPKLEAHRTYLSRNSYKIKINYIVQKNLHINLSRELWFDDLILFSEIRNSLIHNRGAINCETIKKLQDTKWDKSFTDGKKFDLSVADFNNWTKKVRDVSESIYKAVLAKYHDVVK